MFLSWESRAVLTQILDRIELNEKYVCLRLNQSRANKRERHRRFRDLLLKETMTKI